MRALVTATVAGTVLERASDDDRACTLIVSDLHIPGDGGQVLAWFEELLVQAGERGSNCRLLVLGDMFDAYIGPKQAAVGAWRQVVAALRRCVEAGVSIHLLRGNRDFMLDDRFGALSGCRVAAGGLRARLADRDAVLLHGDELCQNDLPYQRAKRWLRHPVTRGLLRSLPLRLALHLAARARVRSSRVIQSGDPDRFTPVDEAIAAAFATGAELLVFGHIHRPARGRLGGADGGEYLVLPAFDEAGVHLRCRAGQIEFVDLEGEVRHFGPVTFAAPRTVR